LAAGAEFYFLGRFEQAPSVLHGAAQADFLFSGEERNTADGT
jgi:hypothetical protein